MQQLLEISGDVYDEVVRRKYNLGTVLFSKDVGCGTFNNSGSF